MLPTGGPGGRIATPDPRAPGPTRIDRSSASPAKTPGPEQTRITYAAPSTSKLRPIRNGGSAYARAIAVLPPRASKTSSRRARRPTSDARRESGNWVIGNRVIDWGIGCLPRGDYESLDSTINHRSSNQLPNYQITQLPNLRGSRQRLPREPPTPHPDEESDADRHIARGGQHTALAKPQFVLAAREELREQPLRHGVVKTMEEDRRPQAARAVGLRMPIEKRLEGPPPRREPGS